MVKWMLIVLVMAVGNLNPVSVLFLLMGVMWQQYLWCHSAALPAHMNLVGIIIVVAVIIYGQVPLSPSFFKKWYRHLWLLKDGLPLFTVSVRLTPQLFSGA